MGFGYFFFIFSFSFLFFHFFVPSSGWRSRCAIEFTCCVSHRWRTSALRTGSDDLWPDSLGGRGSGHDHLSIFSLLN
jgi:hypothetical protein